MTILSHSRTGHLDGAGDLIRVKSRWIEFLRGFIPTPLSRSAKRTVLGRVLAGRGPEGGGSAGELPRLGSDLRKLWAELLWKRTTVSQEWIAGKLRMCGAANVSQQPRRFNRVKPQAKLSHAMRAFLKDAWNAKR